MYDELPRRSFPTPDRLMSSGDYDILPSNNNNNRTDSTEDYDELRPAGVFDEPDGIYDIPRNMRNSKSISIENSVEEEDYDIPRPHALPEKQTSFSNDDYDELPMKSAPPMLKTPLKTLISSDIGSSNGALSGKSFGSRNSIASNSSSDSSSMYHIKVKKIQNNRNFDQKHFSQNNSEILVGN